MSLIVHFILFIKIFYPAFVCGAHNNIVVVFVDDLGFNDVSFQATDSEVKTPNIDTLAASGIKLSNHYVQPVCSPSRTSFLTGRYSYKIGVTQPFGAKDASCLPFKTLLPQTLRTYGYKNHLVGKWHLGFCKDECLPTNRGFDSFYGFYSGALDFYTHEIGRAYDWHLQNSTGNYVLWDEKDQYAVTLLDNRVKSVIQGHDTKDPLFLFLALQSVHSPIQPKDEDVAVFNHVQDEARRKYLALVKGVDDSVKNLVDALKAKEIFNNTLVLFTSDNGGNPTQGASNWPLSGTKGSWYEGGIRSSAFISGPGLSSSTKDGLIHVSDWYPTFVSAIGGTALSGLDGISQWDMLANGGAAVRSEIVHDIDISKSQKNRPFGAIRKDNYKLISMSANKSHEWIAPPESSEASKEITQEDGVQLYDISTDPTESKNLAGERGYKRKRKELLDLLTSYKDAGDIEATVHTEVESPDNTDSDGAFKTGWC